MNPWFKILSVLLLFGTGVAAGIKWDANAKNKIIADNKATFEHERLTWTQAVLNQQQAVTNEVLERDALKTKLGVEHAKNQVAVADLFASLGRVSVTLPTTPCGEATATTGSASSVAASGRTDNPAQRAFDALAAGMASDAREWSEVIENCRVIRDWSIKQSK